MLLRAVAEVGLGRWAQISSQRFQYSRTDYQIRKRYQRLQEQSSTVIRPSYMAPQPPPPHVPYYHGNQEHDHEDEHSISSLIEAAVATTS